MIFFCKVFVYKTILPFIIAFTFHIIISVIFYFILICLFWISVDILCQYCYVHIIIAILPVDFQPGIAMVAAWARVHGKQCIDIWDGVHHDDVIKWKHFPRYWPFVWRIHRSPVNSPHKGQWRGALIFSLICGWINGWVNKREAGDLRRHRGHYDRWLSAKTAVTPLLAHWSYCSLALSQSHRNVMSSDWQFSANRHFSNGAMSLHGTFPLKYFKHSAVPM